MKKHFKQDSFNRIGNNYYPVNGGIFIDLKPEFMYIVPGFPVSAGIVSHSRFELSLHRFPYYDDGLGVGIIPNVTFAAEHSWVIGFNSPKYEFIWRKYIEHRHKPLTLFKGSGDELGQSLGSGQKFMKTWKKQNSSQILIPNRCSHITSVTSREEKFLTSVINICDEPSTFPFQVEEIVKIAGLDPDSDRKEWKIDGKLEFWLYNNTGDNVIKCPRNKGYDMISSYELVSFVSDLELNEASFAIQLFRKVGFMWLIVFVLFAVIGVFVVGKTILAVTKNKKLDSHKV